MPASNVHVTGHPKGVITNDLDALSGPGAVSIRKELTTIITTGTDAFTLADGFSGQYKTIIMITDGGDGTLTPTNLSVSTNIIFDAVGDSVRLLFVNGTWNIVAIQGATVT